MTKPQVGDIIKCVNLFQQEQHYLVLGTSKKKMSLGHPLIRCDLLYLEGGITQKFDVFYQVDGWIKVA